MLPNANQVGRSKAGTRNGLVLGLVGLFAVVAGVSLPQALTQGVPTAARVQEREPAAAGKLAYTPPAWPDAPSPGSMLVRLVLGTVVVLGLCVGTLWLGKRWLRVSPASGTAGGQLRLVDSLLLGNRCTLHLVQAGDCRVLVGIDGSGMKSLVTLPESFAGTLGEAEGPQADAAPSPWTEKPAA